MTTSFSSKQFCRRNLLSSLVLGPWIAGVGGFLSTTSATGADTQGRFKGIGIVLVVDAVPGAEMKGVVFYDDRARTIYASSVVAKRNREIMALGGSRVPSTVRTIWRDKPKPTWGKNGGIDYEGTIIGDHTVEVARRIPDDVLADIRAHGGSLRLKFRLKPNGVLFGWDIERPGGGISRFDMPGGDFLDTRY